MPNTLRVKRGLAATLPNGASGEPLFTTDTYELYIGKGDGTNQRYQKYIASGTTSQYLRGDGSLETHNLDSLTDVVVSSPSNGQFLKYNGTNWVNSAGGFLSGGATAAGQVGVFDAATNIVGYTTFTYDTVTDKLSMTNGYVNNTLTVDGQLVIKSESGASAYTRGLKFPDNSYGGTGDIAGLRLHNAGGENIILELYAGNDSLDTINFAVAAGGSTYNDNVTINGNKIWNAGNLPSPLSSTGTINSGEIPIFSNSTTVYSDTALFWDNSLNRLGVGGTSPNAQVGVSTSSGVNAFGYRTSGANYYELVLVYDNTTYGHTFQANRGSSTSARNITFLNGSNTVSIDESGNMGIGLIVPNPGTSGPGGLGLDIYASTTAALALHNATSGTGISAGGRIYYNSTNMTIRNLSTGNMTMTVDNGNFTVITLGAENIKVEGSTGKVGIGAPASIAEMLTVNGSIQQSGVTSSMLKANASGKIIAAVSNTDFQAPITLTTTGTSGAATFNGTTLNIPQYQAVLTNPVTGSGTNNEIAYFNATGSTIASLSTATYPSLTELSYVKGVTSSIQTQLNGKQNTLTNPVTGTGTSGYHAKFTVTGSTIGNSLIYDNGIRAISIGNSSTNSWASPFYVIEGGSYGGFLGFQTNAADVKFGVGAYWNGSNYVYTNTSIGFGLFNIGGDSTNGYLDFYGAPASTPGLTATPTKKFGIDNAGNGHFVESIGVGFTSGTPNGRIDFRNPANAIIVGKNTVGGTNTYSSIRLTTANSGGVGDSIGEIRGLSTNSSNRDIALTFLTTEGSGSQTEKMRITSGGNVGIGTTDPQTILNGFSSSARGVAISNTYPFIAFNDTDGGNFYVGTQGNIGYVWNAGTDSLILATNNAPRLTISSTGAATFSSSVALGTSLNSTTAAMVVENAGIYGSWVELKATSTGGKRWIMQSTGVSAGEGTGKFVINNATDAITALTISSTGNVGIGTASPSGGISGTEVALHLSNSNVSVLALECTAASGKKYQIYSANDGGLYFRDATSATQRMAITTGGNVGIGTTSPSGKLDVYATGTDLQTYFSQASSGNNNFTRWTRASGPTLIAGVVRSTNDGNQKANTAFIGTSNAYDFLLYSNDLERMRITSGGNVGIGTPSPAQALHVLGGASPVVIASNSSVNLFTEYRYNTSTTVGYIGNGTGIVSGGSSGDFGVRAESALLFCAGGNAERMRITSGGRLLVGTTDAGTDFTRIATPTAGANCLGLVSTDDASGGTYIAFRNSATTFIGGISRVGTTNAVNYATSSDYRLKHDYKDFNGLDIVSKIKSYDFAWNLDNTRMYGVIAHELQEILGYAVVGEKDAKEMQSVDYSKLTPILVKAIQEQQAQIEELKSKLN